jgi:hypothetical protein
MNKTTKPLKKNVKEFMEKIRAEAASQGKYFDIYLAEQSEGLRQMFIRWHKEAIEELEAVKSLDE